ncbi:uncharacterized protein LOC122380680 [Amphibalanus amphitrite]|uniref:uncharacterized protein LOC122380680 n=1 Tax=Amphibalanus amphitrite TaxID=1232801 RepID=UPI001C8FDAA2|nr:uncharacterized protein LOC122380680 [Amphibalanus amphitrite]
MSAWSQTVLLVILAVLVLGAVGRPQYQSGYGTGPLSEAKLWRRVVDTDKEDYRAARAAAAIALRLFRNAGTQTNIIKDVEPIYKYKRPKFATSYRPPAGH